MLTIQEIAERVGRQEVTPSELLDASLKRIEALEGRLQAWSLLDVEGARRQAETLDAEAKAGRLRGPLHGVPVGIKDEFHVQGMPTGMRGPGGRVEPEDATCVARLRDAGAIILGKTHMVVRGKSPPTRNPWNLEHTAGGTSSGSGAAVGSRMVPFAIGEQTRGSNLRPAAYCGVEAMKPTYGRISHFGCMPFSWSNDHVGLIGLTMADIAIVLNALAGPDPKDPSAYDEPPPAADLQMSGYRPPRIGLVRNFYPERAEPVMNAAVESSAKRMTEAGGKVTDALLPQEFGLTWQIFPVMAAEMATYYAAARASDTTLIPERAAELVPATYYLQSRRIRAWLISKLTAMFGDYDALLMPVAPGAAPRGLESTGDASLLSPWSLVGFPAISVNGGATPDGLPLGLQLVAAPRQDYELMRVGAWCEGVLGRLPPPPIA